MILPFSLSQLTKTFLKNDILSIDIGFTNIKIVHARKKPGNVIRIINLGIGDTPVGCIRNGVISNLDGIMGNLKKVIEENGMNERNVKIMISAGSNIISKIIHVDKADEKNIEEKIRDEITRQMPVDIKTQKLFYRITGEQERMGVQYRKVLVTVVPSTIIENYMSLIKLLNFRPISIEIPFSCVARFFNRGVKVNVKDDWNYRSLSSGFEGGSTAVVDLGSETTNLSILNHGALEFNRVILAGGHNLDDMISKKLGISHDLAERYKRIYGITGQSPESDKTEVIVNECMEEYLGELLNNLNRSMEFYEERCGGDNVRRIFFIGGGSGLNGLKEHAQKVTGKMIYNVDNLEFCNVEFDNSVEKENIRFFISALGLAM